MVSGRRNENRKSRASNRASSRVADEGRVVAHGTVASKAVMLNGNECCVGNS